MPTACCRRLSMRRSRLWWCVSFCVRVQMRAHQSVSKFTLSPMPPPSFHHQAHFNASELITQREAVSAQIRKTLSDRSTHFFLDIEDVSIVRLIQERHCRNKFLTSVAFRSSFSPLFTDRLDIQPRVCGRHRVEASRAAGRRARQVCGGEGLCLFFRINFVPGVFIFSFPLRFFAARLVVCAPAMLRPHKTPSRSSSRPKVRPSRRC